MMRERLANVLAWAAFLSLLFGVMPLGAMFIGYQLEELQTKPSFEIYTCEQIQDPDSSYQDLFSQYEKALEEGVDLRGVTVEKFDPEKCRVAGSGKVIRWVRRGGEDSIELGFIYANLSEAQVYERLGYRTFFHSISNARKEWTTLFASPWLPIVLMLYVTTGKFRILPWRK
jgi:hypothetical protein